MIQLSSIAFYVNDKISSSNITLKEYVTTDCIMQNKRGREIATNLPPLSCSLIHYKPRDILIANIRPYLKKIWFADMEGGASSDVLVFRAKEGHSPEFLYAALLQDTFFDYVMQGTKGSKMPRGDKEQIMRFEMPTLFVSEESIGKFILDINRKIHLNEQINQNLEALAKQLYDYWFVQFDFPNEEGKPYKSSGGKMVWNEKLKREIPEGWDACKIKDYLRIFTGKKDVSKAIPGDYKFFSCAPEPITSNEYIYDGAAVLVSGNGSYTGRVSYYKGKFDLYQRTYACVPIKDEDTVSFFFYTLRYLFQPVFSGGKHGSSIPYIVLGDLADFTFAYNRQIVKLFVNIVKTMFDLQFMGKEDDEQLTKQRNELLPLLMNGQITIE
jgi:type I restriction enzyme S subunit